MRKVSEIAGVTKNSDRLTEPMLWRGLSPPAIRVEFTIGPQPPPPIASRKPPAIPSGTSPGTCLRSSRLRTMRPDDQPRHGEQIDGDEDLDRPLRQLGEDIGPDHASEHARGGEPAAQAPVDVLVPDMRRPGEPGRHHLGRMHARAGDGRRRPEGEERRGRDEPVGHAERAVDELRRESERHEEGELAREHRALPAVQRQRRERSAVPVSAGAAPGGMTGTCRMIRSAVVRRARSAMPPLETESRLPDPDQAYRMLIEAHRGLPDDESAALNTRLVLILANHIGSAQVLAEAI